MTNFQTTSEMDIAAPSAVEQTSVPSQTAGLRTVALAGMLGAIVLLGWLGKLELKKQQAALQSMRSSIEGSLAPGEIVVVDDWLLGWALRRNESGALKDSLWVVSENIPASSLLTQMQVAKRRELVVVASPEDKLIQHLDAAGFTVAQEVGWVPWDLKGNGFALLGRGKMRIFFAVAPKNPAAKGAATDDGAVSSESKK